LTVSSSIHAVPLFALTNKPGFITHVSSPISVFSLTTAAVNPTPDAVVTEPYKIYSRKNRERKNLGIVTDDLQLTPAKIIKAYDERWSIEVFFKDAKQLLGLGQYQNRSYRAAVTHLHLVAFAYALLTHIAIDREGAKGKRKRTVKLSVGDLQNELRRIVWESTADYLQELPDGNSVVKELSRLLVAA